MSASFCDTNVLLYLISQDGSKAQQTEELLRQHPIISVQVLNEFANAARRKSMRTWPEILDLLGLLRALSEVCPLTIEIHSLGLEIAARYRFAIYDAMIVAAALEAGCDTLWSEDMQHGQVINDRLRVANPFVDL